ncbi:hypothetical protein B0T22DRAFT_476404 [Podospora appendiculata]|uniref:RBR-type E3 ubiquitin transferase n=1 Tax=Podospora appendiculata TaxID=314037 RepID=A0AAE0XHH1_9PEZI|nr:hypothetical protein B0T22DRAFT_476404 [Podospora appendiculata]
MASTATRSTTTTSTTTAAAAAASPDMISENHIIDWWISHADNGEAESRSENGHGEVEDEGQLDLLEYMPPSALVQLPPSTTTPDTIAAVVQSALRNIIQQIEDEKQRADEAAAQRQEEEAARARAEAEARAQAEEEQAEADVQAEAEAESSETAAAQAQDLDQGQEEATPRADKGKGKATAEDYTDDGLSLHHGSDNASQRTQYTAPGTTEQLASKARPKRSRFGFRRILQSFVERGETRGESSKSSLVVIPGTISPRPYSPRRLTSAEEFSLAYDQGVAMALRSAAVAAVEATATAVVAPVVETVECVSCLDDIDPASGIKTACHYYCGECFQRLIATALENEAQWPPKCCLTNISFLTITRHISGELMEQYREKDAEYSIPVQDRLYCSQPDCGEWIKKVDKANKTAQCSQGHTMCILCRQAPHSLNEPCPQNRDQQLADQLAEEEGWRHCYNCHVLVEHRDACQHMTCRCGAQFCYVCGEQWRTCGCTLEQLSEIKTRAATRRQEREEKEAAENAWLANVLRLIEEFELEERRREDEARAAEEAEREEARRKAEEQRVLREEARLLALAARFEELRTALRALDAFQRAAIDDAQRAEITLHAQRAVDERIELNRTQTAKRAETQRALAAKVAEYERAWDHDWHRRVAWEKQLEEDYARALEGFWGGMVGGPQRAGKAMRAYMRKNDERKHIWERWRDGQVELVRCEVEEEAEIQLELADAVRRRLDRGLAEREAGIGRKHAAELRWFGLVAAERARLLDEMEANERESGGEEGWEEEVSGTEEDQAQA